MSGVERKGICVRSKAVKFFETASKVEKQSTTEVSDYGQID